MKIGLVALAFVAGSVLTGTMAYASVDKKGQPFEELWDAIHGLESDVEEIELTPGPQGPTGATGPPGKDGTDGAEGSKITLTAVEASITCDAHAPCTSDTDCPTDSIAVSGGYNMLETMDLLWSKGSDGGDGWSVGTYNNNGFSTTLTTIVYCTP